jgi:thioredoxin-related protein
MTTIAALAFLEATAAELEWGTNVSKAQAQAKAEDKFVLINFTGSDWCGWCIKLDKEVFSTSEFAEYAKKNLVPVKIDFPRRLPQSRELRKANAKLQEQFRIDGYPAIVVLSSAGREIGRFGYTPGGAGKFIERVEELKPK